MVRRFFFPSFSAFYQKAAPKKTPSSMVSRSHMKLEISKKKIGSDCFLVSRLFKTHILKSNYEKPDLNKRVKKSVPLITQPRTFFMMS